MDELRVEAHAAGLHPSEFWALTPHEIQQFLDGSARRQNRELEILAWHAANIMAPHVRKRIRPSDLLPPALRRRKLEASSFSSVGEFQKAMAERAAEHRAANDPDAEG